MNANEILRIVDAIHRDKNIEKEIVFEGIEAALVSAAKKHYGEEAEIEVQIDREDGSITATNNGEPLDAEETVGRIGAQTAKQVMIQKIREAERDALFDEYEEMLGQLVSGVIQRYEGGAATVSLPNTEAILPRSEQIPGETHHPNERVRTTVCDVRKSGSRVKIILSRTRKELVQRLFEQEIPEIADGVIEIRALAREPGYRSKVAVASSDQRVDCVGACVGVRGNRIKNIVDELAGERIDIVRWSDDLDVLIPNALLGVVLLFALVPARRLAFNSDGVVLAVTIVVVGLLALALGAVFDMKAGFCNSICPVLPVERLYGQRPLVDMPNARCATCSACTTKGCLDLAPQQSMAPMLGAGRKSLGWLKTPFGAFAAAFPGFVYGYFAVPDMAWNGAATVYGTILGWALVSYAITATVAAATGLRSSLVMILLGATAASLYYWYVAASVAAGWGLTAAAVVTLRVLTLSFVGAWALRALRDEQGSSPVYA